MGEHLKSAGHDYIRYANCWEDADILLQALDPKPNARILSVGSAGDNSFALLANDPKLVVAVDLNPVQCKLIELKKAAIQVFDYPDFLSFIGFKESQERNEMFMTLEKVLSKDCFKFWQNKFHLVENDLVYSGKFEKYFNTFAYKILPLIHSKKRIDTLLELKPSKDQDLFYNKQWNNLRWRMLFKIFFSKFVLGHFGRSKTFMKEVEVNVADFIFRKAARHLSSVECQNNFFLRFILTGRFGNELPFYARKKNFENIKKNIQKLEIREAYLEDCLNVDSFYEYVNLSDIFEYMDQETFISAGRKIYTNLLEGTKIAYWNLMVHRKLSDVLKKRFRYLDDMSEGLTRKDKGFFYDKFITEEIL